MIKTINKLLFTILFLLFPVFTFSQETALTSEVVYNNGLVYYNNKPLNGEMYAFDDSAKAPCSCTLKATYKNGKLNGKKTEWFISGQKKYEGPFLNGLKDGTHQEWTKTGKIKTERKYVENMKREEKYYYPSGNLQIHLAFEALPANEITVHAEYFDTPEKIIREKKEFSNGRLNGIYIKNNSEGLPLFKSSYLDGELVEYTKYYGNGTVQQAKIKVKGNDLFAIKNFYENGQLSEEGYLINDVIKDSTWIAYSEKGKAIKEEAFRNNKLTRIGNLNGQERIGEWNFFYTDNATQKSVIYEAGMEVSSKVFNKNHLIRNHLPNPLKRLYAYRSYEVNEYVLWEGDKSIISNEQNRKIHSKLIDQLQNRLSSVSLSRLARDEIINKKLKINGIKIKYKEAVYQKKKFVVGKGLTTVPEKGYDAFISFTLTVTDADDNSVSSKAYIVNKSDKLLNSLFNNLASSYAKSPDQAFKRTLKVLDIQDFLIKNFPIPEDIRNKD